MDISHSTHAPSGGLIGLEIMERSAERPYRDMRKYVLITGLLSGALHGAVHPGAVVVSCLLLVCAQNY